MAITKTVKHKEFKSLNVASNKRAAIAFLCPSETYDYIVAIFEGETLGDAVGKFADWKLDEATMNIDGSWKDCKRMQKAAREWYFPPVPKGFDFSSVEPKHIREASHYEIPHYIESARECGDINGVAFYELSYEDQFADFIGRLKWLSKNDKFIEDFGVSNFDNDNIPMLSLLQCGIPAPYPNSRDVDVLNGFNPIFAQTPYLNDHGEATKREAYHILSVANGGESVDKLKARYAGINRKHISKELQEAYELGQYRILEQWGEHDDMQYIRVEVKGTAFDRARVGRSLEEFRWGWVMRLKVWPKNQIDEEWELDEASEDVLDRIVIESRPIDRRKEFAKWWLDEKLRLIAKSPDNVKLPASIEDQFTPEQRDPSNKEWLTRWNSKRTEAPPSGGRDSAKMPNLRSDNPSFAALLIQYIRDYYENDAPSVYRRAHVSRKTYSSIVSNELRPVSKQTAIMFALALQLQPVAADELLAAAGYALSRFILEDIVIRNCIDSEIYDLERVNEILLAQHAKPLFGQK